MKLLKLFVVCILLLASGTLCLSTVSCSPESPPAAPPAEEDPAPSDHPPVTPADTMTIYVDATSGDDTALGNEDSPLRTLAAAQALAKELHQGELRETTVTILLREGTHTLQETLKLTGKDSHTTYASYPGESAVISGGVTIGGWTQLEGSALWVADAAGIESRDFFVNGKRATRARTDTAPTVIAFDRDTVTVSNEELRGLSRPRDLEFVLKNMWNLPRICAEDYTVDENGNTVFTMVQPGWNTYYETSTLGGAALSPSQFIYAENALEFLDTAGEWYLDTAQGKLYYYPRSGEDMTTANAVLGSLEQLITLKGSAAAAVTDVTFSDLTFSHTTWLQASSDAGLLTIQANFYKREGTTAATQWDNNNWVTPSAAITGSITNGIVFEDNTFCALGNAALHLATGTKNADILGNEVYDCAGSGIVLGGFAATDHNCIDKSGSNLKANWHLVSEFNRIEGNTIEDIGCVYAGGVGICVGYVRTTSVNRNTLTDLPYTAISFGWGWGFNGTELRDAYYADEDGNNLFWGNEICRNYIDNIMNVLFDGGGIYTLGRNDGALIEGNFITNVNNDYGAIYLDDGSVGFTVTENVVMNSHRNYIYKGDRNHIYDNYTTTGTAKQPDFDLRTPLDPDHPDYTFEDNYQWDEAAVDEILANAGA